MSRYLHMFKQFRDVNTKFQLFHDTRTLSKFVDRHHILCEYFYQKRHSAQTICVELAALSEGVPLQSLLLWIMMAGWSVSIPLMHLLLLLLWWQVETIQGDCVL